MPFTDIPSDKPYLRLFHTSPIGQIVFSSHGIWRPSADGMIRVKYTYYWYTQPTAVLTGTQYTQKIASMGACEPVDTFGPGSGAVQNVLFVPLEQSLFAFTAQTFNGTFKATNPKGLALLAFHGNKEVPAMNLRLLDTQLLPALNYPVDRPVHMVVCRSLEMHHVVPRVSNNVVVITEAMTPFNAITNKML